MSVFRVNKNNNYTTMSNYHLKDKRISLKAKGLLSEMLSLPDDWNYTIEGLASINKESAKQIKLVLDELKQYQYLYINKLMPNETKTGRIEYIYDIYEIPKTRVPKQEGCKQEVENKRVVLGDNKILIQNTNILNTNNIKESIKEKFEELWKLYPNKKGKAEAYKHFEKAIKKGVKIETIEDGIQRYVAFIEAEHIIPKYIKHGSTWFNQECWNDDYTINRKPTTKDLANKIDFMNFLKEDNDE